MKPYDEQLKFLNYLKLSHHMYATGDTFPHKKYITLERKKEKKHNLLNILYTTRPDKHGRFVLVPCKK